MTKLKKWAQQWALILVGLCLGAWQEHLKMDINYVLEQGVLVPGFEQLEVADRIQQLRTTHAYMPFDYFYSHTPLPWVVGQSLSNLRLLKWVITALSLCLFFAINRALIATFDTTHTYKKPLRWGYLCILLFGLLIFVGSRLAGAPDKGYLVARELVGGLQSMVPVMIVYPLHLLQQLMSKTNHE